MLTLTSLTIWLRWEQAVSGGSGFAGSSGSGFAGSSGSGFAGSSGSGFAGSSGMLALTSDNLASQGASC